MSRILHREDEPYGDPDSSEGEWLSSRFALESPATEDSEIARDLVSVAMAVGHHGVFRLIGNGLVGGIRVPIALADKTAAELRNRICLEQGGSLTATIIAKA